MAVFSGPVPSESANLFTTFETELRDEIEFINFLKKKLYDIMEQRNSGNYSDFKLGFELGVLYRMLEQLTGDVVKLSEDFNEIKILSE